MYTVFDLPWQEIRKLKRLANRHRVVYTVVKLDRRMIFKRYDFVFHCTLDKIKNLI
jgi:hypothetical protein